MESNSMDVSDEISEDLSQEHNDKLSNDNYNNSLVHFYCLQKKVICIMEPESYFTFFGKLKVNILYGNIEIYGTRLNKLNNKDIIEVYSPRGHNFVSIKCLNFNDNLLPNDEIYSIENVWNSIEDHKIYKNINNIMQEQIDNLKFGWSVVLLENFENTMTKFLNRYSAIKLFPKIINYEYLSWTDIKNVEYTLQAIIYHNYNTNKLFNINFNKIESVIDTIVDRQLSETNPINTKTILTGGKNVGKSTTMRYLVNKLLKRNDQVIVIDLDLGQCEFTPAGCISMNIIEKPLLGPNFTHLNPPYHQYFIGGTDVSRYLSFYINATKKLIEYLNNYINSCDKNIPIVINTMGFCRAIGFDIICYIIKSIQPTDVIQISSKDMRNNFHSKLNYFTIKNKSNDWATWTLPDNINSFSNYNLHLIDSNAEVKNPLKEAWKMEPYQLREISLMSYLSQIFNDKQSYSYNLNLTFNISEILPYEIPFSNVTLSIESTLTTQILPIINGNIVALCGTNFNDNENQLTNDDVNSDSSYPKIYVKMPLATCYGFGIVRGIDMENEMIYINTPLSMPVMKYVNCLIGSIPTPLSLLQSNHTNSVPYTGKLCQLPTSREAKRRSFKSPRNKSKKSQ